MSKKNSIHKKDVFLYRPPAHKNYLCQLKDFIHFLHIHGVPRPFKFSYVEAFGPLLTNLTLKDNILLESIQNSLSETKEIQLSKVLNQTKNGHLMKFFQELEAKNFLNKTPMEVSPRIRKIAALVKGLLQESDFLFFDIPEAYLTPADLDLFISALKFQIKYLDQVALITSPNEQQWFKHITKLITRGPAQEFVITPVLAHKIFEKHCKIEKLPPKERFYVESLAFKIANKESA